jgi:hypothetical protein
MRREQLQRAAFEEAMQAAEIDLEAELRMPIMGVAPFWQVNPYYPGLLVEAVLEDSGKGTHIAVVPASIATETHAKLDQCLGAFLRLSDVDRQPKRVLAFVRRYGLAGFCPHAYEQGGSEGLRTAIPWRLFSDCPDCKAGGPLNRREPIRAYIMCSRQLRAALKLAAALRIAEAEAKEKQVKVKGLHRSAHSADVRSLFFDEYDEAFFFALEFEKQWEQLAFVAHSWLDWSKPPIWPSVAKDGNGVSVQIRAYTLMHLLALQFSAAISSKEGWYVCDVCSHLFARKRRPRAGSRRLCPICAVSPDVVYPRKRKSWNKRQAELGRPRQRKSKYSGEIAEA